MLNANKKYYYNDEYMYFWFDGQHSAKYNLFIVNSNGLTIENSYGTSTEYIKAMSQEGSHLLGATRSQKTIKRTVAAEGLSLIQYKEMMLWLMEGKTGWLSFDSNPYWGWTVILEQVDDSNVYYTECGMVVELQLTWKTIGLPYATNRYASTQLDINTWTGIVADNEYGAPSVVNNLGLWILNLGNIGQHINITGSIAENSTEDIKIIIDSNKQCVLLKRKSTSQTELQYDGASDTLLLDGKLAEQSDSTISLTQSIGPQLLTGLPPFIITTDNYQECKSNWSTYYTKYQYLVQTQIESKSAVWDESWGTKPQKTAYSKVTQIPVNCPSITDWTKTIYTLFTATPIDVTGFTINQVQVQHYNVL